jgi:hypothetical protein
LTKYLGVWARLGWSDGQTESRAFTEFDQTAALGILLLTCHRSDTPSGFRRADMIAW